MTNKDFFSAVATGTMNDEIKAFAQKYLDDAAAKTSADKARRDAENAPLIENIKNILADGEVKTAGALAEMMNLSTSKITALVKKIDGIKVSQVVVNKRIVNGYSL